MMGGGRMAKNSSRNSQTRASSFMARSECLIVGALEDVM